MSNILNPGVRVFLLHEDREPATIVKRQSDGYWYQIKTDVGRELYAVRDEIEPIPVELLEASALAHSDQGLMAANELIEEIEANPEMFAPMLASVPEGWFDRLKGVRDLLQEINQGISENIRRDRGDTP